MGSIRQEREKGGWGRRKMNKRRRGQKKNKQRGRKLQRKRRK